MPSIKQPRQEELWTSSLGLNAGPFDMNIQIKEVISDPELAQVKKLFYDYGVERTFDKALGDYQTEMDELPGKYGAPGGILFMILVDSQPAGCIAYQKLSADTCEMKRMYISPPFRGKGLGKVLIRHLLDEAVKAGYAKMKLDTHPTMFSAQKLYQEFGFRRTTRYNQNPIEGIIFFERDL